MINKLSNATVRLPRLRPAIVIRALIGIQVRQTVYRYFLPRSMMTDNTFHYSWRSLQVTLPHQENAADSPFDKILCKRWNTAMLEGQFRYNLSQVQTRVLPGSHGYVALLNVKRATERRAPESMTSLDQPYNTHKFNFTRVAPSEVLLVLKNESQTYRTSSEDKILINVSPADYGHSLIVPEIDSQHNQNLTLHGCKLALQVMCLSTNRGFRIGFNSLCAHASVNHQHLHCYYTDERLIAERMDAQKICKNMHLLISDAPPGYGFQVECASQLDCVARAVYNCTEHMRRKNIAHGIFICRGMPFSDTSTESGNDCKHVVRILLWPRTKVLGPKPSEAAFNSAILEMAGHLLIKEEAYYHSITDEAAYKCLRDTSIPDKEFDKLTNELCDIIANE